MGASGISTQKTIDLHLTFLVKCTESECTALCLELDIASCGQSSEDAITSLKGLIELYVLDCVESGQEQIPLRPVPRESLEEFLAPPVEQEELSIISRHIPLSIPIPHAA